jgi:hypothetical protein
MSIIVEDSSYGTVFEEKFGKEQRILNTEKYICYSCSKAEVHTQMFSEEN